MVISLNSVFCSSEPYSLKVLSKQI